MGDCAPFCGKNSLKMHKSPEICFSCGIYSTVKYMEE